MGTKAIRKRCDEHGEFTTGGPAGKCPQCKGLKGPTPNKPREAAVPSRVGMVISLDLSRRPELAKRLHDLAEQAYRTVELQVLYMLTQEYERRTE